MAQRSPVTGQQAHTGEHIDLSGMDFAELNRSKSAHSIWYGGDVKEILAYGLNSTSTHYEHRNARTIMTVDLAGLKSAKPDFNIDMAVFFKGDTDISLRAALPPVLQNAKEFKFIIDKGTDQNNNVTYVVQTCYPCS